MELNYNLQVNNLQLKKGVRDLKIRALKRIKIRKIYAYEFWTVCFNSDSRSNSLADPLSPGQQIQRGVQGQAFGVRQQLICTAFAQLTWHNGIRDIEACLNAKSQKHSSAYFKNFF